MEEPNKNTMPNIIESNNNLPTSPNQLKHHTPKHNHYKLVITIMVSLIIILTGVILYLLFFPLAKSDNQTHTDDQLSQSCPEPTNCENHLQEEASVKEVVAKIHQSISDTMRANNQSSLDYDLYQIYDANVSYQPEGYLTGVPLTKSYGVTLDAKFYRLGQPGYDLVTNRTIYRTISNALLDAGFTDTGQEYTTASAASASGTFINPTTGIVCTVLLSGASCGYKTWYNQDTANLSNTLARVYEETTGKPAHYLVAQTQYIEDSPITPYQRIEVAMPGFGAAFYRVNPDAEWQYFTEGQSTPQCNEYNTEDLRKAFAGTSCFTDTTGEPMGTVQP